MNKNSICRIQICGFQSNNLALLDIYLICIHSNKNSRPPTFPATMGKLQWMLCEVSDEKEREEKRGRKRKDRGQSGEQSLCSRLHSKQPVCRLGPSATSWCCVLGEAIRAEALAHSGAWPAGHGKTAQPFSTRRKGQCLWCKHFTTCCFWWRKQGRGKNKRARVIEFSWLSSNANTSPTLNSS